MNIRTPREEANGLSDRRLEEATKRRVRRPMSRKDLSECEECCYGSES